MVLTGSGKNIDVTLSVKTDHFSDFVKTDITPAESTFIADHTCNC